METSSQQDLHADPTARAQWVRSACHRPFGCWASNRTYGVDPSALKTPTHAGDEHRGILSL